MTALDKAAQAAALRSTDHCSFCPSLCLHACPTATAEASTTASPWGMMLLLRWMSSGEARPTPDAVASLHHCTQCGACTDACLHQVPVAATLRDAAGRFAAAGLTPVPALRIAVPIESDAGAPLPIGVSGAALLAAGHTARFQEVARAAASRWSGRSSLAFESLLDLLCVADDFPDAGAAVRAVLRVQPADPPPEAGSLAAAAWFEPCSLARTTHLDRKAVRASAERAAGAPFVSLRWEGTAATCCGARGDYPWVSPEGARLAARRVLEAAIAKGQTTLVVPCGQCARHLEASRGDLPIAVRAVAAG